MRRFHVDIDVVPITTSISAFHRSPLPVCTLRQIDDVYARLGFPVADVCAGQHAKGKSFAVRRQFGSEGPTSNVGKSERKLFESRYNDISPFLSLFGSSELSVASLFDTCSLPVPCRQPLGFVNSNFRVL
jgi:hypothetical protein